MFHAFLFFFEHTTFIPCFPELLVPYRLSCNPRMGMPILVAQFHSLTSVYYGQDATTGLGTPDFQLLLRAALCPKETKNR